MTVGKCKGDFVFSRDHGFTGSAGMTQVKGYARGGMPRMATKAPKATLPARSRPALSMLNGAPMTAVPAVQPLKKGGKVKGKGC